MSYNTRSMATKIGMTPHPTSPWRQSIGRTLTPSQISARVQFKNYREENEEFMSGRQLKLSAEDAGEAPSDVISSPDKVVDAIYRGILMGRFVPGQKLIEADLALSFGVSRGPIREALKRLSA